MRFIALLLWTVLPVVAIADEQKSFRVMEVQQTGGIAGIMISYRITSDGKYTRTTDRGLLKGRLSSKDARKLREAVAKIDWKALPDKLRDPNVADDFIYKMHFVIGEKTECVTADGVSAGKHPQLKHVLAILNGIQRAPEKPKRRDR